MGHVAGTGRAHDEVAADAERRLALYAFVPGRRLEAAEIDDAWRRVQLLGDTLRGEELQALSDREILRQALSAEAEPDYRTSGEEDVEHRPLDVTQLISVTEAPDGRSLAFAAVGKLWTAARDDRGIGSPRRVTDANVREHYPAFSPDGRWIVTE